MAARGRFQRARPVACRGASGRPPPAGCLPYLPRLGLGIVSRASVPQGSISTPTHAVSAPHAPTISLSFAPFGQYPVAHRPSVPRWLAGGSRAVSTPACVAGPSLVRPPPRASASNVQASEPRASARRPSPSAGTRVPSPGCPASPATGRLHYQPGPRPGRAPSTAPPGPPEADPDPGPRLRHRGLRAPAHKSGSERRSAVEAIGRFINQSPGCRQGTILAPVAAWQPLPGSGAVSALGHFGTKTRPRGRARLRDQRRDRQRISGYRLGRAWRLVSHRAVAISVAQASVT